MSLKFSKADTIVNVTIKEGEKYRLVNLYYIIVANFIICVFLHKSYKFYMHDTKKYLYTSLLGSEKRKL